MKIRVFTAFSGYDSQCMALDRLKDDYPGFDYELVGWSEIDRYAIMAHNAVYPQWEDRNYGDISKIDWRTVPDFDLFTYSFPCFVRGTIVMTSEGFKPIEDIKEEESVVTHCNRYRNVTKTMQRRYCGDIYTVKAMPVDEIRCTPEHPFYVRDRRRIWNNSTRRYDRIFMEPHWIPAKDLTEDCYVGVPVNTASAIPVWDGVIDNRWGHHKRINNLQPLFNNSMFWYLMGRYVGDGWKKLSHTGNGIVICCGGRNRGLLVDAIEACGLNYTLSKERTVEKFIICSNELCEFVSRYGYRAHGKRIDSDTMNLPVELLRHFIDGYEDSDGCVSGKYHKITSVSREMIYGVAQCVAKVYRTTYDVES